MFSVSGLDVDEDGRGAGLGDGLDAGVEGERDGDDLVARSHAEGAEGDRQAVGAVGDADGSRRPEIRRGLIFKALDVRPQDHAPAAQHLQHGALDALLQLGVLSFDVHQADGHGRASLGPGSVRDATTRAGGRPPPPRTRGFVKKGRAVIDDAPCGWSPAVPLAACRPIVEMAGRVRDRCGRPPGASPACSSS